MKKKEKTKVEQSENTSFQTHLCNLPELLAERPRLLLIAVKLQQFVFSVLHCSRS